MPPSSLLDWLVDNEPSFRKTRLPSLFSDLNVQKQTNPEGYAANVQAWQAALTRAALAEQLPTKQLFIVQTSDELVSALSSPQYGRPSGLGVVIDDSIREGKMIEVKDFVAAEQSIYSSRNRSWIPSSTWSVLKWGVQQVVGRGGGTSYNIGSGKLRLGSLVIVPALEDVSKRIESWWLHGQNKGQHASGSGSGSGEALTDRVISREEFAKQLPSILQESSSSSPSSLHALTSQDVDILLHHLSRDRQLLSYNKNAIKFKPRSAIGSLQTHQLQQTPPDPITAEDSSIANLKQLISSLSAQCTRLESTISTQQSRAATMVAQKNKTSALAALRSKKRAEQALAQRMATLHQLEDVYHSIEQAVDQISIVETLQSSATTLKSLNQKVGSVERVQDVIDELREQMDKTNELSSVLQEPLREDGAAALADIEVDDELEAMEREEEERLAAEQTRKRLYDDKAGQAPQNLPGVMHKDEDKNEQAESLLAKSVEKMDALHLAE